MMSWLTATLFLPLVFAAPQDAPEPAEPKVEPKSAPKADAAPATPRAMPELKTPQAGEKLQDGLKKIETGEYSAARTVLSGILKDAATPADRKLLQGLIDDTKLGSEIDAARDMVKRKDERRAIQRVERAIKTYPESALRPEAERFILETEEVIYLILDDFEPGDSLQRHTEGGGDEPKVEDLKDAKSARDYLTSRWRKNMGFNSDPRFVRHGKGSMKWRIGGDYYGLYRYWYEGYGYNSTELKNAITKWRHLVFWVFLPEADEGTLRVTMSPEKEMGVYGSLYNKKLIDLRGKRGWMEVRMDLRNDFGGTAIVKLEDIRYIRIDNLNIKYRTIYLDFVHLE